MPYICLENFMSSEIQQAKRLNSPSAKPLEITIYFPKAFNLHEKPLNKPP